MNADDLLRRALGELTRVNHVTDGLKRKALLEEIRAYLDAPRKPMTDAEILKEWQCHFYDDGWIGFEAGIRFAERHHGIGGGDE